ncbi:MAG: InlB B-repeat-containing protein, partial [Alphaproteobacteria bacterium]|nr:InlB B-repeat-containing protein [Alphaproteobacteria bacterium]
LDTWNGVTMALNANPITVPSRNGYAFAGYYADANSTTALIGANGYITSAGITAARKAGSDITWVAKWTPNTITIIYDSNGGTSVASTTCEYDSTFVLAAAPANSGKQFRNWWVSLNGGTYNAGATIDCNYAKLGVYSGPARITANWDTCPAGSYCPADSAPQKCPTYYPNSDDGATIDSDCYLTTTAGKFVATPKAAEETCKSGGYYCPGNVRVNYGSTGGISECDDLSGIDVPNGTYSTSPSTGASASSACRYVAPSDKTVTGCSTVTPNTVSYTGSKWNSNYYAVKAAKGYHVGDNNVANPTCVICGADKYQASDDSTATSCTSCLTNYHTYGNTAADHNAASDCLISCDGGYYLAKANNTTCSNVGAGYWAQGSMVAQGSVGSRNACDDGLTTIGYGFGANEEDDCGRIFNYGNQKIYLRSAKRDASQPALHVQIGDTIFYGTMQRVSGPQSGFNAEYDGKNYMIINDNQ